MVEILLSVDLAHGRLNGGGIAGHSGRNDVTVGQKRLLHDKDRFGNGVFDG